MDILAEAIYFFLPAYFANAAPVFFSNIKTLPFLDRPLDRGIFFFGKPLFGAHKTAKGFLVGFMAASLTVFLQIQLMTIDAFDLITITPFDILPFFLWGFLFGVGALFGDLFFSFFKRRFGRASGQPWFLFDQLDYFFGAFLFLSPFFLPGSEHILILLIITPLISFGANIISYFLGWKKVWW